MSAVTRAGVSNLRHGQAARAHRPAQTRRECGRERERERERSKSIEVGGSRIRKLEKTLGPLFTKKEYIDKSESKFPIKFQLNMEE